VRYLRTYENLSEKKFYRVKTADPYFEISIKKIGITDDIDSIRYHIFGIPDGSKWLRMKKENSIFITIDENDDWGYGPINKKNLKYLENSGFKNMGEINIDFELATYKYNL
jgi:hypothetical protein